MRLTLRTLLAYLDDVLDPVDKDELAQKIESSEFAEDLVHRTRDTVRRLRLSAPQVIGTGMGLDPNSVAEYLDNVLPPEQVGDFERICLESDVHLAEAAACHHVLTMVLGEPADVDPLARQRMYSIADEGSRRKQLRVEPAHRPAVGAAPAATRPAVAPAAVTTAPRTAEVPEYLRAGSWWRSTNAVIGLAAIVLVGTAVVLLSGLRGWLGGGEERLQVANNSTAAGRAEPAAQSAPLPPLQTGDAAGPASGDRSEAGTPPVVEGAAPNEGTIAGGSPIMPDAPPAPLTPGVGPPATDSAGPTAPADSSATGSRYQVPTDSDVGGVATAAPNGSGEAPTPAVPEGTGLPAPAGPPANDTIANLPPQGAGAIGPPEGSPLPPVPSNGATMPAVPAGTPEDPETMRIARGTAASDAGLGPVNPEVAATDPAASAPAGSPTPPQPAPEPVAGAYLGGKTVLLRQDEQSGAWHRIEPRAALRPGERVLALPEFRPRIALASGVQLDIAGGSQVMISLEEASVPAGSPLVPSLDLVYGRIVLMNPTNIDKPVRLKLGAQEGVATLGSNATLAVELERKYMPGVDPRQTASPVEVRMFAPDGRMTWQDGSGEKAIEKPSRWMLADGGVTELVDDSAPPEWIDHEPIGVASEQRYGAPKIDETLVAGMPVDTQLLELYQTSKQKEVKSLVARSSIHVGLFQPFIDALRDSDQKANWKSHIDALRSAMALSPESANRVHDALVDQRGRPAAADLYEMLCGYNAEQVGTTPDQMKLGAVVKLINWLENDSLDYRVLAVQNLYEITGKRLMANPAASLNERTINVRRWRTRLESGELKPPAAPN